MTSDVLEVSGVSLPLKRPGGARDLRAWDAADEQLLAQTFARFAPESSPRVLVVDDQFGALTLGLAAFAPVSFADSCSLAVALVMNAHAAESVAAPLSWLAPPEGPFDLVVMRIPRQVDYLACLLRWVNSVLAPEGTLLAAGMIKHLPDSSAGVFADLVHTREVCPARKKARVIVAAPGDPTLRNWTELWKGYPLPQSGHSVNAMPAVFARDRLDIGTRLLLPLVRRTAGGLEPAARVLDLACGNGVLGLAALAENPELAVTFSDVSSQAVASARNNALNAFPEAEVDFYHSDGIPEEAGRFQLIILNPPFHEGGVVGDHIALRLFRQVARHLVPGGRMLMVGNRHLGYHRSLKRFFSTVRQLDADPRFVVFEAGTQEAGRS
ncbi:class I SAM-dependent methyltransferase [Marinobacter vulgaris]|uniref:Class I SAM-dependent methyltransferase n=1 Tax=Marinobacter vulgaris TaxID=1928331 RepID=A0A2V3ZN80_9GAMM|nr:class I SAM-dependent methyltransferase [Marinobacter vulgaris]PXX91114.1 class I SAM-dependent methyltransferase [Marinobacter vulgaris]TSJ70039.1 class I SAM-dependent methyltransferase [Marinobacter vulgaris]